MNNTGHLVAPDVMWRVSALNNIRFSSKGLQLVLEHRCPVGFEKASDLYHGAMPVCCIHMHSWDSPQPVALQWSEVEIPRCYLLIHRVCGHLVRGSKRGADALHWSRWG